MKNVFLLFMLLFFSLPVWAVKMTSLYQADIPVSTQAEEERARAMREGLMEVLIKVSGDPDMVNNPIIKANLTRADYYVQEYNYSSPTADSATYLIQIRYEPEDVDALLKKAGIAHWGLNRPLLLVWLVVSDHQKPSIIGGESPGDVLHKMEQQGKRYGIPLIFPMMDMTDMSAVSVDDVMHFSTEKLQSAAVRYLPAGLLVGNITQKELSYQSEWRLILNGTEWNYTVSGTSTNEILTAVVSQISQTLSKHYEVKTEASLSQWLTLKVMNVTQRDDLTQLMQYLKQLSPVLQVQLSQVSGDQVELAVEIKGNITAFQKNASIGQRLQLKSQDDANNQLVYEWIH